tara:strand:- start:11214 stop:11585 length:372 start_codon:yes stop_codon:yes gene_type:complete
MTETVSATGDLLHFKLAADEGAEAQAQVVTAASVGPGYYLFRRNLEHPIYWLNKQTELDVTGDPGGDWPYNIPDDGHDTIYYVLHVETESEMLDDNLVCGNHPAMQIALTFNSECPSAVNTSP